MTNYSALIPMGTGIGRLLAFLLPTDCLRSLENWPPFHRAFRQYVGNPEAIGNLYDYTTPQLPLRVSTGQFSPPPNGGFTANIVLFPDFLLGIHWLPGILLLNK